MRWFALVALAALALAAGASPAHEITFSVQLRLNMTRLDHDLSAGRRISSPAELGRRYGLSLASERHVEAVLQAHGIQVVATYPQRTTIELRASPTAIRRFFHGGVPAQLRPWVKSVLLSRRPVAFANDLPHGTLLPEDAALAYDVTPLHKLGIDGTGQTIAILSLSPFPANGKDTADDISTFRKKYAPHGPDPQDVAVHGGGTVNDYSEDDLDIDVISGIAPGAQIVNYEAPSTAIGIVALFNHLVLDNRAKFASFSWGACNAGLPGAYLDAVNTALKLAVLRGITVFVASGDSGSYDCQRANFADHRLTVDFPASSPQVVAVGGTLLSVDKNGNYAGEAGWENTLSFAGGGGGIDPTGDAPSWQAAAGVKGHRGLPDVSASASPDSGWAVRDYGNWDTVGGTSAATPFWAASMLLAQQLAKKQGVSKSCFLAPILYKLATTKQPYPGFHDVKAGGNRYYDAKPGWDYATGLGSPDVWNLARDLVAFLRKNPCPPGA